MDAFDDSFKIIQELSTSIYYLVYSRFHVCCKRSGVEKLSDASKNAHRHFVILKRHPCNKECHDLKTTLMKMEGGSRKPGLEAVFQDLRLIIFSEMGT